jgi:hypothetical protein
MKIHSFGILHIPHFRSHTMPSFILGWATDPIHALRGELSKSSPTSRRFILFEKFVTRGMDVKGGIKTPQCNNASMKIHSFRTRKSDDSLHPCASAWAPPFNIIPVLRDKLAKK